MKKIMKSLAIVAVAIFAGYNVYQSNNETEGMSDTMLANVEALAGEEWEGDNHCHMDPTFWICLKYTEGVGCYCGV